MLSLTNKLVSLAKDKHNWHTPFCVSDIFNRLLAAKKVILCRSSARGMYGCNDKRHNGGWER